MGNLVNKVLHGQIVTMPSHFSSSLQDLARSLLTRQENRRPTPSAILQSPFIVKYLREDKRARREAIEMELKRQEEMRANYQDKLSKMKQKKEGITATREKRKSSEGSNSTSQRPNPPARDSPVQAPVQYVPCQFFHNLLSKSSPRVAAVHSQASSDNGASKETKRKALQQRVKARQTAAMNVYQLRRDKLKEKDTGSGPSTPRQVAESQAVDSPKPEAQDPVDPFQPSKELQRSNKGGFFAPWMVDKLGQPVQVEEISSPCSPPPSSTESQEFPVFEVPLTPRSMGEKVEKWYEEKVRESDIRIKVLRESLVNLGDDDEVSDLEEDDTDSVDRDSSSEEEEEEDETPLLHGSLSSRITNIREQCIQRLGVDVFQRMYDYMKNCGGDEEQLQKSLAQWVNPQEAQQYSSLIAQLIFCEETLA